MYEPRGSTVVTRRPVPPPKTVEEYIANAPPEFQAALRHICTTIRAIAPDAEEGISYGMPAFRQNGMRLYVAAFKDHLSFFGWASVRGQFVAELKPFEEGKGTLRFTPDRPLPDELVARIVAASLLVNSRRRAR
jgi:uncharacterized protein YdhG (YjbR/CyaY superfamily)